MSKGIFVKLSASADLYGNPQCKAILDKMGIVDSPFGCQVGITSDIDAEEHFRPYLNTFRACGFAVRISVFEHTRELSTTDNPEIVIDQSLTRNQPKSISDPEAPSTVSDSSGEITSVTQDMQFDGARSKERKVLETWSIVRKLENGRWELLATRKSPKGAIDCRKTLHARMGINSLRICDEDGVLQTAGGDGMSLIEDFDIFEPDEVIETVRL